MLARLRLRSKVCWQFLSTAGEPAGIAIACAAALLFLFVAPVSAQSNDDLSIKQNDQKARAVLSAMVQALGGDAWTNMQNRYLEGRRSSFYRGDPTGGIVDFYEYHQYPDKDCTLYTKKRDVAEMLIGQNGWEITYRGKKPWPADELDSGLRRRDHSIEVALKVWLKDPRTVLFYDGQSLVQRHLADKVRLISAENDSITIEIDAQTHLPIRRSYQWRDPLYKDKNEASEEYDDYHVFGGVQTPFTITNYKNGEMSDQRFLYKGNYNVAIPPEIFDVDKMAAKLKK
jgi:hypothetical protein